MNFNKFLQISITLLFCIFVPFWAKGAILYFDPADGQYQPGQTFIVKVKIDTEQECINAIRVDLSYNKDVLEIIDFSQGKSIISLWLEPLDINKEEGKIYFSGGIPGGYCGQLPGDPGESDVLGKIIFKMPGLSATEKEKNIAEIKFSENSQVLLNDAFGTKARLTLRGAKFEISEKAPSVIDQWEKEILEDKIPPESFEVLVLKEPSVFEEKYFIIFQTLDKQTGIDYYEIKEGERDWKKAVSPYMLENQRLSSIIKVRAIDKAGNERMAEYIPSLVRRGLPWWAIILILIGAIAWWIITKLRRDHKRKRHKAYV